MHVGFRCYEHQYCEGLLLYLFFLGPLAALVENCGESVFLAGRQFRGIGLGGFTSGANYESPRVFCIRRAAPGFPEEEAGTAPSYSAEQPLEQRLGEGGEAVLPACPTSRMRRAAGRLAGCGRAAGGMGLLQDCQAAFGAADLYGALGVRREASPEEIRRAYHRASLRVHPDRAEPEAKEEATRRFQVSASGRAAD